MRRFLPLVLLGCCLVARGDDKPAVRFTEFLIADKYGYTFGSAAADLDGDGDLDLTNVDIVGKRPSSASLFWFENNGKGEFERHVLHEKEDGWLERHAIGHIDGDGRLDVAVVSNRDGLLLWFSQPKDPKSGPWKRNVISAKVPGSYDVALADLDGDGDLDAASASYQGNVVSWFENPGRDKVGGEWTRHVLDTAISENRTIRVGDFNRDGKPDLLAAAVGIAYGADGDKTPPAVHRGCVAWHENPGAPGKTWTKHVIDDTSRGAVHGHPVDFDKDGDLDVVMAFGMRPEHIPVEKHEIVWYENVGSSGKGSEWKRHVVAPFACAFETIPVDLDGDGDLDLAATSWSRGDKVAWFENPGKPAEATAPWKMHVLKENWYAANQIIAADLNGDGRPDLVGTSDDGSRRVPGANEFRWWRNEGR